MRSADMRLRHQLHVARIAGGVIAAAVALGGCKRRPAPATTTSSAQPSAAAPATERPIAAGLQAGSLTTADGRTRRYFTYWPKSAGDEPPLLLVLHGGGGTATGAQETTFSHAAAERHGWFTVYAEGIVKSALGKDLATWNAGVCCGEAKAQNVDDVGFLISLLDQLASRFPFDSDRVYATGISNGGMMATRLACERPERVAGIAAIGSPGYKCADGKPVAVQIIHGTDDGCALYAGGNACGGCWARAFTEVTKIPMPEQTFSCIGAEDQVAFWRGVNGCTEAGVTTFERGGARCIQYAHCTSGKPVGFCKIDGGGHTWPGSRHDCDLAKRGCRVYADIVGPISQDLDANDAMITFFGAAPR